MRPLTLHVLEQDITAGECSSLRHCAIACAYQRVTGNICEVSNVLVDQTTGTVYDLPELAHHFIFDFDDGKGVKPVSFQLWPAMNEEVRQFQEAA